MTNDQPNRRLYNIFVWASLFTLFWLVFLLTFTVIGFSLHHEISSLNIIVGTLASFILTTIFMVVKKESIREILIAVSLSVLIIVLSILVNSKLFDNSWDGQDYQQRSIIQLISGFNPIFQTALPEDAYFNVPFNHYPLGPWILSASIIKISDNLEAGKAINCISLILSFFMCLALFYSMNGLGKWKPVLYALLISLNPVTLVQLFTYYVDGLVATYFLIVMVAMVLAIKETNILNLGNLFLSIIICVNIKFTATAYVFLLLLLLFAGVVFVFKRSSRTIYIFIALFCGGLFGIFGIGFHPYLTNWIQQGSPVYPIVNGKSGFDQAYIMSNQSPKNFSGKSEYKKLLLSILSKSENSYGENNSKLKIPFSVTKDEIFSFRAPDLRVGGFGPWFSGILIVSFLILFSLVLFDQSKTLIGGIYILCIVLVTMILNSENWWARYAPQLWYIPGIILFLSFSSKKKSIKYANSILAILIGINILMVGLPNVYYNVRESRNIDRELTNISNSNQEYLFFIGPFYPWVEKFEKYQISYELVSSADELPCPKYLQLIQYSPKICQ